MEVIFPCCGNFFPFSVLLLWLRRIKCKQFNPNQHENIQEIFFIFLFFFPLVLKAEVKEIPFTLDDRDRIIRTEQKLESLHSEVNTRFDQLFNFLWAIIEIFTSMMVSVFGFAFWDRKFTQAGML